MGLLSSTESTVCCTVFVIKGKTVAARNVISNDWVPPLNLGHQEEDGVDETGCEKAKPSAMRKRKRKASDSCVDNLEILVSTKFYFTFEQFLSFDSGNLFCLLKR